MLAWVAILSAVSISPPSRNSQAKASLGGLSYLSTQHGWAVDNVLEFEVVLANASIVTATKTHNVDLFNVLKGGGNNFGVVTSYTLKAYPMGGVRA
jgi:FAD/FMN-containing dehydrogenase